jgi:hypothetical protein
MNLFLIMPNCSIKSRTHDSFRIHCIYLCPFSGALKHLRGMKLSHVDVVACSLSVHTSVLLSHKSVLSVAQAIILLIPEFLEFHCNASAIVLVS